MLKFNLQFFGEDDSGLTDLTHDTWSDDEWNDLSDSEIDDILGVENGENEGDLDFLSSDEDSDAEDDKDKFKKNTKKKKSLLQKKSEETQEEEIQDEVQPESILDEENNTQFEDYSQDNIPEVQNPPHDFIPENHIAEDYEPTSEPVESDNFIHQKILSVDNEGILAAEQPDTFDNNLGFDGFLDTSIDPVDTEGRVRASGEIMETPVSVSPYWDESQSDATEAIWDNTQNAPSVIETDVPLSTNNEWEVVDDASDTKVWELEAGTSDGSLSLVSDNNLELVENEAISTSVWDSPDDYYDGFLQASVLGSDLSDTTFDILTSSKEEFSSYDDESINNFIINNAPTQEVNQDVNVEMPVSNESDGFIHTGILSTDNSVNSTLTDEVADKVLSNYDMSNMTGNHSTNPSSVLDENREAVEVKTKSDNNSFTHPVVSPDMSDEHIKTLLNSCETKEEEQLVKNYIEQNNSFIQQLSLYTANQIDFNKLVEASSELEIAKEELSHKIPYTQAERNARKAELIQGIDNGTLIPGKDASGTSVIQKRSCPRCGGPLGACSCVTASNSNMKTADEVTAEARNINDKKIRSIDRIKYDKLQYLGQYAESAAASVVNSNDSTASAGLSELKNSTGMQVASILLSGSGQSAAMRSQLDKLIQQEKASNLASSIMEKNDISASVFNSRREMMSALSDANVSLLDRETLLKNYKAVSNNIRAKSALETMSKDAEFGKSFEMKLGKGKNALSGADLLKEKKFFTETASSDISKLSRVYFNNSIGGAHLAKMNFDRMSSRQLRKLAKNPHKYQFSKDEGAVASLMANSMRKENLKRSLKGTRRGSGKIKSLSRLGLRKTILSESTYNETSKVAKTFVRASRIGIKTAVVTAKIIGKVTGITFLAKTTSRFLKTNIGKLTNRVKKVVRTKAASFAKPAKEAVSRHLNVAKHRFNNTTAGRAVKKVSGGINQAKGGINKARNGMNAAKNSMRNTGRKFLNSKVGRTAKTAGKVAGRTILSPVRLLGKLINALQIIKKYIAMAVGGVLLMFIVPYLLIIVMSCLMSSCGMSDELKKSTKETYDTIIDTYENVIMYDDYDDMKKDIDWMLEEDEKIYQECEDLGTGYPKNDNVLEGHTIDKYGNPYKSKGYTITYLDAYGNILPNKTTNAKDVEGVCISMISNLMGDYSWFYSTDLRHFDDLLKDMYNLMHYTNPDTGEPYEWEESEIYACPYGCDKFKYYCNNEDGSYERYLQYKADGVGFYESASDIYNKTHKYYYTPSKWEACERLFGNTDYDNYRRILSVSGKGCRVRWNSVSVPVYRDYDTGEYLYTAEWLESNYSYDTIYDWTHGYWDGWNYHYPQIYKSSETRYEVEYYCSGHENIRCCYGHKDIDIYVTLYDVSYVTGNNIYPADYESKSYGEMLEHWKDDKWSSDKSVQCAYNYSSGDWYDMYGITIEGCEFATSKVLNPSQQAEILERYDGDIEKARKDLIEYGLQYVGKIQYYWGGKASNAGWDGNNFGSRVEEDYKGRNIKGLDCSGFVSWVYKSALGMSVPGSTAGYSGKSQISKSQLQVGDLGFINNPGAKENHVAIYMGKNNNGQDEWLECNSSSGSCITTSTAYKYFVSPLG